MAMPAATRTEAAIIRPKVRIRVRSGTDGRAAKGRNI
jgi:hypothetical protein